MPSQATLGAEVTEPGAKGGGMRGGGGRWDAAASVGQLQGFRVEASYCGRLVATGLTGGGREAARLPGELQLQAGPAERSVAGGEPRPPQEGSDVAVTREAPAERSLNGREPGGGGRRRVRRRPVRHRPRRHVNSSGFPRLARSQPRRQGDANSLLGSLNHSWRRLNFAHGRVGNVPQLSLVK